MNSPNNPTPHFPSQIQERETQEEEELALLLKRYLSKNDQILVQKTQMGGREAYIGSVTLEWFASSVRFASHLPLFHHKINPETDNVEIDAETIDEIQQRPLDWSRQAPLAQYLAVSKSHKFPPVLVVINQPWVDNSTAEEWDVNGRAIKSVTDFMPLDKDGEIGLLDLSQEIAIFALDGQHRLMGVQGLMELIKTGKLQRYKKDKKPLDVFVKVEDLRQLYKVDSVYLQNLAKERIGIEFISAVVAGETREEARRRVRSIFVHVNLMAVSLSKGQLAQLDEDDGFSIVARKIAVTHPLLKDKKERNPRVNWNSATVTAKSTVLTTLQALKDMSVRYLDYKFTNWKSSDQKNLIPMRPEDNELEEGIAEFSQLFNYLASLPSYQRMEEGIETPKLRRFSFEKDGGEGNMLFRPIGQIALVQALGILVFRKHFSLEDIFTKLRHYDTVGGFSGMEYPKSLWYGVLYDPYKKKVLVSGRDLASKLLIYILGGINDDFERAELRRELAINRHVGAGQSMGFEGKFVKPREVGLPEVL
ncbi:DGQHR domain-containing protein [Limnofasciculus baicalensis]|uniref:DGQHR domain-containing protein n=1 Tax=Limnofasciculus baicalensis BBK-W-15 TaxID=2699891 RepID=A0AAE3GP36_9CYAN|nr:DGQHR domain-containing protein [Limnofasciculus baicalensis]MCP2727539.1 DGQHR domain-containing protein [Limnofasciculus baicalensis BBK-W-15]